MGLNIVDLNLLFFSCVKESKHTYFLHSDCLDKLGLCIVDGCPNKTYCIGEVVDKEYCQTRKVSLFVFFVGFCYA